MNAATARIHCRPAVSDKTAAALIEMMQVAAKQLYGYEGPVDVEILPDREAFFETYETPSQDDFFYAQHMF
ncbi:MAG: hypothetical protein IPG22_16355 [Acidobacteria bacterium]|nr:hypothetical protein [Acidobacteriota bacterium]